MRLSFPLLRSFGRAYFFGSDEFSSIVLRSLKDSLTDIVAVYPSVGSHTHGKQKINHLQEQATKLGIPSVLWNGNGALISEIRSSNSTLDLGIVASFGKKLSTALTKEFPNGIINIHPSLLPRWRGGAPIQHAILAGDKETGVTVMKLEGEKFDSGRILVQKSIEIGNEATFSQLRDNLGVMGADIVADVLNDFDWHCSQAKDQGDQGMTYAKKIPKEAGFITFDDSITIDRKFRAIGHYPGILCTLNEIRVKLVRLSHVADGEISEECAELKAGEGLHRNDWDHVYIKCQKGGIVVGEFQMPFKAIISARDFSNAYMQKTSDRWKTIKFGKEEK